MISPSTFTGDPYGYVTNQIGHGGGVGLGLAIYASAMGLTWLAAWPAAVVVYWVLIEYGLQEASRPGNASFFDGIEDAMHVGFGVALHSVILYHDVAAAGLFTLWMCLLGFGAWLRT